MALATAHLEDRATGRAAASGPALTIDGAYTQFSPYISCTPARWVAETMAERIGQRRLEHLGARDAAGSVERGERLGADDVLAGLRGRLGDRPVQEVRHAQVHDVDIGPIENAVVIVVDVGHAPALGEGLAARQGTICGRDQARLVAAHAGVAAGARSGIKPGR